MAIDATLLSAWQDGWSPPERLTVPQFAVKYISLPAGYAIPGKVDLSRSKYMAEVFAALQDPRVRIVIVQAAVQTGKSLLADLFIPWLIVNAPGNILWLTADEALAKSYAETRVNPILYSCDPVKKLLPANRHFRRKTSVIFPNHTSLIIGGANESNLQSLSCRYLVGDEVWLWKSGFVDQFLARSKAFPNNSKVLLISQAGDEAHDFTELWKRGHQGEWGFICPKCQLLQPYDFARQRNDSTWAGIRWDENETTKPGGHYNIVEAIKTTRLECFGCGHRIEDGPTTRRALNDSGAYLIHNPNASPEIKSFTWNSLANIDLSFASVASEFLNAKQAFDIGGYFEPTKQFYQKSLAKPWNANASRAHTKAALGDYDVSAEWKDEAHRFLTCDVQRDCFWVVVRAWAKNGESRLLFWGRLETWEQVRETQQKFSVKDQKVFIDCGFDEQTVFQQCVKHGHEGRLGNNPKHWYCWNALRGSPSRDFAHTDAKGNKDRRIYSVPTKGNPGLGQYATSLRCDVYLFSSEAASDILHRHYTGKAAKFLVAKDDPEYTAQMNSETKRKFTDPKTGKDSWAWVKVSSKRANHIWDDEKSQIVAASIAGVLGDRPAENDAPTPDDPAAIPQTL